MIKSTVGVVLAAGALILASACDNRSAGGEVADREAGADTTASTTGWDGNPENIVEWGWASYAHPDIECSNGSVAPRNRSLPFTKNEKAGWTWPLNVEGANVINAVRLATNTAGIRDLDNQSIDKPAEQLLFEQGGKTPPGTALCQGGSLPKLAVPLVDAGKMLCISPLEHPAVETEICSGKPTLFAARDLSAERTFRLEVTQSTYPQSVGKCAAREASDQTLRTADCDSSRDDQIFRFSGAALVNVPSGQCLTHADPTGGTGYNGRFVDCDGGSAPGAPQILLTDNGAIKGGRSNRCAVYPSVTEKSVKALDCPPRVPGNWVRGPLGMSGFPPDVGVVVASGPGAGIGCLEGAENQIVSVTLSPECDLGNPDPTSQTRSLLGWKVDTDKLVTKHWLSHTDECLDFDGRYGPSGLGARPCDGRIEPVKWIPSIEADQFLQGKASNPALYLSGTSQQLKDWRVEGRFDPSEASPVAGTSKGVKATDRYFNWISGSVTSGAAGPEVKAQCGTGDESVLACVVRQTAANPGQNAAAVGVDYWNLPIKVTIENQSNDTMMISPAPLAKKPAESNKASTFAAGTYAEHAEPSALPANGYVQINSKSSEKGVRSGSIGFLRVTKNQDGARHDLSFDLEMAVKVVKVGQLLNTYKEAGIIDKRQPEVGADMVIEDCALDREPKEFTDKSNPRFRPVFHDSWLASCGVQGIRIRPGSKSNPEPNQLDSDTLKVTSYRPLAQTGPADADHLCASTKLSRIVNPGPSARSLGPDGYIEVVVGIENTQGSRGTAECSADLRLDGS